MNAVVSNQEWFSTIHPAFEKLARFKSYKDGWAFGEGLAFSLRVSLGAEALAARAVETNEDFDVFPGRNGQIVVTFYYEGGYSLDLSVFEDANSTLLVSVEWDQQEDDSDSDLDLPDLSITQIFSTPSRIARR